MHIRTHKQGHTDVYTQRYEHMSWRTLNEATVTTAAEHTYSQGQKRRRLTDSPTL